jgi:hypothetical protein
MDLSILQSMWSRLSAPASSERIKVLRFSPECLPQLFLGLDKEGKRCVLLMDNTAIQIPSNSHENLSLEYLRDSNSGYVAIRLDNASFLDLFDDFVASIYCQLSSHERTLELSSEFIRIFSRWSSFFDSLESRNLSFESLMGLMGELTYLGLLLEDTQLGDADDILRSWVGPYHTRTDFELPGRHVEVKAISNSGKQVTISSEYQLEKEAGLGIELVVVHLEKAPVEGVSIREKIEDLRDVTHQLHGDFSIMLKSLRKLGLSHSNFGEYDNTRFKFLHKDTYDAAADGFPKLVRSNIPSSIKSVKYTLKLHELSDYLATEDYPKND